MLRNLRYLELLDGLLPDLRAVSAVGVGRGEVPYFKNKNDLIKNTGAETVFLSYSSLCVLHLGREDKVLVQVVHVLHHPALGGPAKADEVERLEVLDHLAEANAACMHGAG